VKGAANEAGKPVREGSFAKDLVDPGVVDGVEGLGSVEEEKKLLLVAFNSTVEKTVDVLDVRVAVNTDEKALLSWIEESRDSRHDSVGNGEDTIISVSDTDRAGV